MSSERSINIDNYNNILAATAMVFATVVYNREHRTVTSILICERLKEHLHCARQRNLVFRLRKFTVFHQYLQTNNRIAQTYDSPMKSYP